jgi:RNA polymerase sigma-70 factor, ECF subfamily
LRGFDKKPETQDALSGTFPVMDPSDAEYLARSVIDPSAFAFIYDRHFERLHRYLHRRVGRDLADELAAETFAVAFARRTTCRSRESVLPWLHGIATNLLRRHRRAESRQLRAYSRSGIDNWIADDAGETPPHGGPLDARLAGALAAMRPRERDALLLYALADLSYEEIAVALAVPLGTVRTWLHRARQTARYELSRDEMSVSTFATTGVDLDG